MDETGKITGYKTSVGGADTVFPFSDTPNFVTITTVYNDAKYAAVKVCYHDSTDTVGSRMWQCTGGSTELIRINWGNPAYTWVLTALKDVKGSYNLKAGESVSWYYDSSVAIALYKS